MAIIPGDEKVFMVDKRTNTVYGGSAALQAMQQWYTMQDIIDSVPVTPADTPTLQEVLNEGATAANKSIVLSNNSEYFPTMLALNGTGYGVQGINVTTDMGFAISAYSNNTAISASSAERAILAESMGSVTLAAVNNGGGTGVSGSSVFGVGGEFTTQVGDFALISQGEAAKPGGGSWAAYSDSRLKENVAPYTRGLTEILLVNPVSFEYNGLANTKKGKGYTGVIAQEIKDIFPETVSTYKAKLNEDDEEKTELYDFNSTALTFALINAIKELKAEIDLLKSK
jgi:hypothetical protein